MLHAKPIQVLIVDDHTMVREALCTALRLYPNIHVVGEATDGEEALAFAEQVQPTVIIMDINLPKMDGITATRLIKAQSPEIVIIGITAQTQDYQAYAMRKAGAVDVLKKDDAAHELYGVIQHAIAAIK